jgi:hypothetical protein
MMMIRNIFIRIVLYKIVLMGTVRHKYIVLNRRDQCSGSMTFGVYPDLDPRIHASD